MNNSLNITEQEIAKVAEPFVGGVQVIERMKSGCKNIVYKVIGEGSAIIRIAESFAVPFESERWAQDLCIEKGIPVPRILYIGNLEKGEEKVYYQVQEFVEGEPLKNILEKATDKEVHASLIKSGVQLAKLNSIPMKGFGQFDEHGKTKYETWKEAVMADWDEEWIKKLFEKIGLSGEQFTKVKECVLKLADFEVKESVMLHDDYHDEHVMFQDGEVTGIIDFGNVCAGHYLEDVARRETHEKDDQRMEQFLDGYAMIRPEVQEEMHTEFYVLVKVHRLMSLLGFYVKQMEKTSEDWVQSGLDHKKAQLLHCLQILKFRLFSR